MTRYAKALAALLTALAAWGATAAPDYNTADLWGLCAVVATALTVYAVPNRPPRGRRRRPDVSEQDPAAAGT